MSNQTTHIAETASPRRATTAAKESPPTGLQSQVAGIAETAARLALHLVGQQDRLDTLATLSAERAAIHDALDRETVDYVAASAKLAGIADKYAALEFTTGKRGENVLSDANRLRDQMVCLKHDLLAAANRAAGAAVAARQIEIATKISSWDGTPAPASPLPLWTVANADPVCRALEKHRIALESWLPDAGPAAFHAVAAAAADFLATVPVPEDLGLRYGGPVVTGHAILAGWDGVSPGLEIVGIFDTPAEAMDEFHSIRNRSVFAGQRALYRLSYTHPEGEGNVPPETARNLDWRSNGSFIEKYPPGSGTDPQFIRVTRAWLDLKA